MTRVLRLAAMPVLGMMFIGVSAYLNWAPLRVRLTGEKVAGRVAGMAIVRGRTNDVITSIETEVEVTYETGLGTLVGYTDYELRGAWRVEKDGGKEEIGTNEVRREVVALAEEVARRSADRIREIMKRESRKSAREGERVVRIIKTETARGFLDVGRLQPALTWDETGIQPVNRDGSTVTAGFVRTHAVFDMRDMAAVQSNKGDTMMSYRQERNGEEVRPEKRNFVLYCEPFSTEFRPVFTYEVAGKRYARLSHIGRHGGPTLALVLFGPCWVYYDKTAPEKAVLIANPGKMDGAVLAWFSRLCEGAFAQWGSGALIVLVGVIMIVLGMIQISLVVWPSGRLVVEE